MFKIQEFKKGIIAGIPIALGYFAVSFSFGMLASTSGISILDATIISMSNLTSAGQFAGLNIILNNGTYIEMILTQFVINLRYALMSFSLSQKLDKKEKRLYKYITAFGVTDEIFAVSIAQENTLSSCFNFGAMFVAIPGWVLGTLFGAILGNVLPSSITSALSVSLYGMFIAIFIPISKKNKAVLYVVISSMIMSYLFTIIPALNSISNGFVIIITTISISVLAAYFKPIKENDNA